MGALSINLDMSLVKYQGGLKLFLNFYYLIEIDIFLLSGDQLPYCGTWRRETEGGPHTSPYQVRKCVKKGDCKIDSQLAFQGNDGPVCGGLDQ